MCIWENLIALLTRTWNICIRSSETKCMVSELRKSKAEHYTKYFSTHKSNMKQLWAGIRSIVDLRYQNVGSCISYLIHDNVKVEDSKVMTNMFNNVFVNAAKKINEKISRTRMSPLWLPDSKKFEFFFLFLQSHLLKFKIPSTLFTSGKAVGPSCQLRQGSALL